jgi:hypothetical protein
MRKLNIEKLTMENQHYIGIQVKANDEEAKQNIRTLQGRMWHISERIWLIPYTPESYNQLKALFPNQLEIIVQAEPRQILPNTQPPIPSQNLKSS